MIEALESNPAAFVSRYGDAVARMETATDEFGVAEWRNIARRMRARWREWHGEDCLHEMALGEPVE